MLKWILIVVGAVAVLVVAAAVVGMFLPKSHIASRTATVAAPPEQVFQTILDVDRYPQWRSDITRVERRPDDGRGALWLETSRNGAILYRMEEALPNSKVVTRIADPTLPYGGTWTFEIVPNGQGASVTITEAGEVSNPIFRVMQRVFFAPTDSIDRYLDALAVRLRR